MPEPSWECKPSEWQAGPALANNIAEGTMLADCIVSGARSSAVGNLYRSWINLVRGSHQVNEGPISEMFSGLPGVHFDVVEKTKGENGTPMFIHEEAHVASDRSSKFVYSTNSKDIHATGNSALLKKLDVTITVTPIPGKKGVYHFQLSNTLAVEKPWYAPTGIFMSEVMKSSIRSFDRTRDLLMPDVIKRMTAGSHFASNEDFRD
ncbi:MAG: hypothetical protein ACXWPM_07405 [Bdellovibrionota bacterium]